ncbi:MAG: hypothetical protein ABI861_00020 [Panacibacter sp.]
MKNILIVFATFLFFTACSKNANEESAVKASDNSSVKATGTITGMDEKKCACCWGWLVNIDGKECKFDKIPEGSSLNVNNISYPTKVKIEWKDAEGDCSGKLIEVVSLSPL